MRELEVKIKEIEMKIEELQLQQETIKETIEEHMDESEVRVIVDQLLSEKELMTRADLEQKTSETQLQLIKWAVGTAISTGAVLFGLIRFFI